MDCGYRLVFYGSGLRWPQVQEETDMDTKAFQLTEHFLFCELTRSQTAANRNQVLTYTGGRPCRQN